MEFSKVYREQLLTDLKKLFAFTSAADAGAQQNTYLFAGAVPPYQTLLDTLQAEWVEPADGVAPKVPSSAQSALNANYVGRATDLLKAFTHATVYDQVSVANTMATDPASNTTTLDLPVAVAGPFTGTTPVLNGFDPVVQGEKTLTWALTLWGTEASNNATYRAWYVMHRIGTSDDPQAELVLADPVLVTANPAITPIQLYSPVF